MASCQQDVALYVTLEKAPSKDIAIWTSPKSEKNQIYLLTRLVNTLVLHITHKQQLHHVSLSKARVYRQVGRLLNIHVFPLSSVDVCQEHGSEVGSSWLPNTELSYVSQGAAILHRAMGILQQQGGWQTETNQVESLELVLSTVLPKLGKVFRMETVLDAAVDQLHCELFEKLEQMPEWNPSLSQVKILQRIGKNTLLTHEVTAQSPGNLIGQRDFVNVRHCWKKETTVYLVGTAIHSEFMPLQKGQVRAESGLSCIVLQPLEGDRRQTHFTWLLSMDLKGWIPTSVINHVLPQSQVDFIGHLRQHLSTIAHP
uniref:Steroidogenic acute regulatory protein, mitochondrial n=1 Tax=Pelusios castaneus TaxID=367368 RepID=A0A8C8RG37_9SAUR